MYMYMHPDPFRRHEEFRVSKEALKMSHYNFDYLVSRAVYFISGQQCFNARLTSFTKKKIYHISPS